MPIRPRPFTFLCGRCGWKKTVAPLSDALGPGDYFERCARCGHQPLDMRAAGVFDALLAEWRSRLPR